MPGKNPLAFILSIAAGRVLTQVTRGLTLGLPLGAWARVEGQVAETAPAFPANEQPEGAP